MHGVRDGTELSPCILDLGLKRPEQSALGIGVEPYQGGSEIPVRVGELGSGRLEKGEKLLAGIGAADWRSGDIDPSDVDDVAFGFGGRADSRHQVKCGLDLVFGVGHL